MKRKQDGFTIVAAIFILVILSILGISIVHVSSIAKATLRNSLQGNRAYYAAKAGLEWEIFNIQFNKECPANKTLNLTQEGAADFDVAVTCVKSEFQEGGDAQNYTLVKVFDLTAKAETGSFGMEDFASRELELSTFTVEEVSIP